MPFCPQCGVENPASARFCDQCGAVLVAVPVQGRPVAPAIPVPPAGAAPVTGRAAPMPTSCPTCGAAVIPGEAFCDTCGASLLGPARPTAPAPPFGGVPPQPSYPAPQPVAPAPPPLVTPPLVTPPQPAPAPEPAPLPPARTTLAPARLVVQPSGATIALPATPQALAGRADAVSNFFPDVDLSEYGGLDLGVGRRHARFFVQGGQIFVEDLDSTNGTFLNAARLSPRQPAPLKQGDELRLANLRLRVEL